MLFSKFNVDFVFLDRHDMTRYGLLLI